MFGKKARTGNRALAGLFVLIALVVANSIALANAALPSFEVTKAVPSQLGEFRLVAEAKEAKITIENIKPGESPELKTITEARYRNPAGAEIQVSTLTWQSDSAAYAHFTFLRKGRANASDPAGGPIGTSSAVTERGIIFFKGPRSVELINNSENNPAPAIELARLYAATLPSGEDDLPVLVKHLPNWEVMQRSTLYVVDALYLGNAVPGQPVLEAIQFDGGTEAVVADYGQSRLVIVEFTTPQFSIDNDQRVWTKIAELKGTGQPTPTAYRRVGNYSVFVFNAPDEKTANALVEQVKYEQVVQWLGDDPHLYEKLQKYFAQTSAGVLVAVLKSSGLSLLLCIAAGALIGTMMFRRRRAQRATAYSDAGGSIRLNLDDLTAPASRQRLLQSGKPSQNPES